MGKKVLFKKIGQRINHEKKDFLTSECKSYLLFGYLCMNTQNPMKQTLKTKVMNIKFYFLFKSISYWTALHHYKPK